MARTVTLKFGPYYANDAEAAISGAITADLKDAFFLVNPVTRERTLYRRPGLEKQLDLGTAKPVDGLFWWDNLGVMVAVSDGRLFKITDNNGSFTEITGATLAKMRRATFATDGTNLLVANGGQINLTTGTTAAPLADPDAPTACSHVAWMDTYFLANNAGSDKFSYTRVGNFPDDWAALDFEVAMTSPDPTVALVVDNGEIVCFGKLSTEVFYDDGVSPFSRNDAATMNHGCIAPYSAIKAKGAWLWLNERREVVTPNGRTPAAVSEPIARILQDMGEASDAQADSFTLGGQTFYVLSFPTAGKTLVLNLTTMEWCGEWGHFANGEYSQWLGNCHAYSPAWNQHLVGSRIDGKIYRLAADLTSDAGTEIRTLLRTGNVNHGTLRYKQNLTLRLNFRRIVAGTTDPARVMIRWRESGSPTWGNEVWFDITGNTGDTTPSVLLRGLGSYRNRQYEIVMTDAAPLAFMGAEEEVELL